MNRPLAISIWFACCVSIGIAMAWSDGVPAIALLQTAAIATAIGTAATLTTWLTRRRKNRK